MSEGSVVVRLMRTPSPYLNPNRKAGSKLGSLLRSKEKREVFDEAYYATREVKGGLAAAPKYALTAYVGWEKGRKIWDDDNLIAAMKQIRDGIAKGLDLDDRCMFWRGVNQSVNHAGTLEIVVEPHDE